MVDFFVIRNKQLYDVDKLHEVESVNWLAVFAWLIGIIVSILTNQEYITLTTIEVCDALLITGVFYYFAMTIKVKKKKLKT